MPKRPKGGEDNQSKNTSRNQAKSLSALKCFGQNFLKNPGILDKIVEASGLPNNHQTDVVFEIGPGTGNLTSRLLPLAKTVICQEIDPRMVAEVSKRAQREGHPAHKIIVKQGDCLKAEWPPFTACVANLPYQISSPFTFKLLAHRVVCPWRCAVIMFQAEFAERLIALPGQKLFGRLALNTALFAKVTRVCKVDRNSFSPPPKVDSCVVKFVPHDRPVDVDFREFDGLMRVVMSRKHKTLRASFGGKSVLAVLEKNFKAFWGLKGVKGEQNVESLIVAELKDWRGKRQVEEAEEEEETADESEENEMEIAGVIKKRKLESANQDVLDLATVELDDIETKPVFRKLFKLLVMSILEQCDQGKSRAITLDLNEYLNILLAFNKKGVHFSNSTQGKKEKRGWEDIKMEDYNDMDEH